MKQFVPLFENYQDSELQSRTQDALHKLEEYRPDFDVSDYELDYETKPDSGRGDSGMLAFIEFTGIDPEVIQDISDNYQKYHDNFKRWCEDNGLYASQILTRDDSVTFEVIVS